MPHRDDRPAVTRRQLLRGAGIAAVAALPVLRAGAAYAAPATTLPSRDSILTAMRLVNDHWIGAHTDPGDNQWARATYFSGNMAAYRTTGDARYLTYARQWGEKHSYGLNGGVSTRHADNHTAGQAYYDLYDIDGDAAKVAAINESIRLMVYGTQASKVDDWSWVDALHMVMPVFVRAGRFFNDDTYLTSLYTRYQHTKKSRKLYDYTSELWYRDERFRPGGSLATSPNGKAMFWSRGNGWAIAAHAKTNALLAADATRWPEYQWNMQGLARTLLKVQRSDGFFNVNLADANHYPGPETSGTAFFAYGLAYAIRTGIIDRATYLPVAAKAWSALTTTAVQSDGFLGYVQGVGDQPGSSQPVTTSSTADFGVGAFLLAGSELAKLA